MFVWNTFKVEELEFWKQVQFPLLQSFEAFERFYIVKRNNDVIVQDLLHWQ